MLLKIKGNGTVDSANLSCVGISYGNNGHCSVVGISKKGRHVLLETTNETKARNLISEIKG